MEKELEKLKELEHQLTLIRDDFSGYGEFVERNIRQSKEMVELENSILDIIESIESLDFTADTDKERELLKLKIVNIIRIGIPEPITEKQ